MSEAVQDCKSFMSSQLNSSNQKLIKCINNKQDHYELRTQRNGNIFLLPCNMLIKTVHANSPQKYSKLVSEIFISTEATIITIPKRQRHWSLLFLLLQLLSNSFTLVSGERLSLMLRVSSLFDLYMTMPKHMILLQLQVKFSVSDCIFINFLKIKWYSIFVIYVLLQTSFKLYNIVH